MKTKEISVSLGRKDTINSEKGFFGKELNITKTVELEGENPEEVVKQLKEITNKEIEEFFNPFKKEKKNDS